MERIKKLLVLWSLSVVCCPLLTMIIPSMLQYEEVQSVFPCVERTCSHCREAHDHKKNKLNHKEVSNIKNIGVIIVSYNTARLLDNCLQSLQACTLPLTIVVVDNHSTDDSVSNVQKKFPSVHVYALEQNLGFAAATNVGLAMMGISKIGISNTSLTVPDDAPDLVLVLNPDTVVHSGAIEAMADFLQHHPRVGMVGPRLLNPDGTRQLAAFRFPTLMMSLFDLFPPGEVLPGRWYGSWWHGRYPEEQKGDDPFPIDHPLGACMLVRRSVIEEVGTMDERYFMYSEEIEWCWRIRQAGWAIWQVPQSQVTHVGGAATKQFRHRMLVALHRSRIIFFQQHYTPSFLFLHRCITQAGMWRAMLQTWHAYATHRIGLEELRARLWAYGEICRL